MERGRRSLARTTTGGATGGQSLLEMALVALLLFFLVFGILDGGRLLSAYLVITNEAREGARWAVVDRANRVNQTAIESYIRQRTAGVLDQGNLTVTAIVPPSNAPDPYLAVQVDYDLTLVTPLIAPFFGDTVTLRAESVMRVER